jgi:hypothetical protein
MKFLPAFIVLLLAIASSQAVLETSAGRDYPVVWNETQGNWHYQSRWQNGTISRLSQYPALSMWIDLPGVSGNGLVTNASTTYKAETGVSLFVQPSGPRAAGSYNITLNWTSNFTGYANVSGWFQRWAATAHSYNFTIYINAVPKYSVEYTDSANYTYAINPEVYAGDNISLVFAPKTLEEYPALNMTAYIERLSGFTVIEIIANTPANNTGNMTLSIPFGYTPALVNVSQANIANASVWTNISGWSILASNASAVANNSFNWINASFPNHRQFKWAIQVCRDKGVCNMTGNYTLSLTAPRLYTSASDENSLAMLFFNITISNATNSTTFTNQYWLNKSAEEIPTGAVSATVSNHTCLTGNPLPRTYAFSIAAGNVNLSAYLLCDGSSPALTNFYIVDFTGRPVSGALLDAKKLINGAYQTVDSKYSDSSGTVGTYLDVTTSYQVNVEKTGYLPHQSVIMPTQSSYTITLYGSNSTVGFQTIFDSLYYEIQPQTSYVYGNLTTLSFYLNDSLAQLNYWGWNVTWNDSATLYTQNWTANASGGYDSIAVNISVQNKTGNLTVHYWFSRGNYSQFDLERIYLINPTNVSETSLSEAIKYPKATGAPTPLFIILGAVLIPFITRSFTKFTTGGGGFIALAWWALWAYAGFLSWTAYAITALTFFAYKAMTKAY